MRLKHKINSNTTNYFLESEDWEETPSQGLFNRDPDTGIAFWTSCSIGPSYYCDASFIRVCRYHATEEGAFETTREISMIEDIQLIECE